jgi:5'-nucleotidase
MKLLVTNDDGIDSAFLQALVAALRQDGHELFVVAPRKEQSWVGAGKSRSRPVHSAECDRGLGCPTWVVDGTPSDCVNIALDHLLPGAPEAVISGINLGMNASLGFILGSGTIAGAWEGALHGLPAIAFSQDVSYEAYEQLKLDGGRLDDQMQAVILVSARHAARLTTTLLHAGPHHPFVVHNVNFPFPCQVDTPVRRTVPAHMLVPRLFSRQADDGTHRLVFRIGEDVSPPGLVSDRVALAAREISHTVLDYTCLGRPA